MTDQKLEQKENILQIIERTPPSQLPAVPEIADRWKKLYVAINMGGQMTPAAMQQASSFYEAEKFHFMKMINENAKLKECSKLSLYGCWMDVAVNRLSFDPSYKHLYLVPFNVNAGTRDRPKWEKRASLQISGKGELLLRQLQGQIRYADNPVLVYESDVFKHGTRNGVYFVDHESVIPRKSKVIVACYLKITRIDGSTDYKVITQEDMDRFRSFSKDKDSTAWTDGEGGMWLSKCIKHAFGNYPKIRVMGKFSELQTNTIDAEAETINGISAAAPEDIDYGIDQTDQPNQQERTEDAAAEVVSTTTAKPVQSTAPPDDDFSAGQQGASNNGTVKVGEEDDAF